MFVKNICINTAINGNFHLSHLKSMETKVAMATRVLTLIITKKNTIIYVKANVSNMYTKYLTDAILCEIKKRIGPTASEKKLSRTLREHAHVIYTAIFHGCKNDNFLMKNCDKFLIFAQNRLWVQIRTASLRRF